MYNYFEAVKNDVLEAIPDYDFSDFDTIEEFEEKLFNDLWIDDAVTGNGSGSYTFSSYQAEENLCHNLDLLAEACDDFGNDMDLLKDGAEACDVAIRCYLLPGAISDALAEIEDDFDAVHEEEAED